MSLTVPPGSWPTDRGHRDAIDTLLLPMAEPTLPSCGGAPVKVY